MESPPTVPKPSSPPPEPHRWSHLQNKNGWAEISQIGLFIFVSGYILHQMKPVLLPLVLALMATLLLFPIYKFFRKLRLPRLIASSLTVAGLVAILTFGVYQMAGPGARWTQEVDIEKMSSRVREIFQPVKKMEKNVQAIADKVGSATEAVPTEKSEDARDLKNAAEASGNPPDSSDTVNPEPDNGGIGIIPTEPEAPGDPDAEPAPDEPAPRNAPVVVQIQEDPVDLMMNEVQAMGIRTLAFLFLVLFMLAYGSRLLRALNRNPETGELLTKMGHDVARYLLTISVINAGLGLAIGIGMWILGMPNPTLWGLAGMALNYIPYIGALVGTVLVFLVAAITFDQPGQVVIIPFTYWILTFIEGNFVTPLVLGNRFSLNPLIVFVWIFAWGGFWGIAGMLIAMPALVIFNIICQNTPYLERSRAILNS